jgi:hypothetical protein
MDRGATVVRRKWRKDMTETATIAAAETTTARLVTLELLEAKIEEGVRAYVQAGEALEEIRSEGLYRDAG